MFKVEENAVICNLVDFSSFVQISFSGRSWQGSAVVMHVSQRTCHQDFAEQVASQNISSLALQVPTLQTPEGAVWESNAIARYVARLADKGLFGITAFDAVSSNSLFIICPRHTSVCFPCTFFVSGT